MTKTFTSGQLFNRLLKGLCIVSAICVSSLSVAQDEEPESNPPILLSWALNKTTVNVWNPEEDPGISMDIQVSDETGIEPFGARVYDSNGNRLEFMAWFGPTSEPVGNVEFWGTYWPEARYLPQGSYYFELSIRDYIGNASPLQRRYFAVITEPPPPDSDGDGVPDPSDVFPFDASEWIDSDGDGVGDNSDLYPSDPSKWLADDTDSDGVIDSVDNCTNDKNSDQLDTDGDLTGDACDSDDDNDDITDADEATNGTNPLLADTDADGVDDADDAFPLNAGESVDTDSDGIGNNADSDDDNDGYTDTEETAAGTDPLDANSIPRGGLPIWLLKAVKDKMEQDATN
jgi:hypothetical protein